MKSALEFHGVTLPQIRTASRQWCNEHPELTREELIAAANALYDTPYFDLRSAAIGILERRRALLVPKDADWLIDLVRRSAAWAHVDWLSSKVLGDLVTRNPALLSRLPRWAKDRDFWVRRASLLAQVDELRAGRGDFALFARIATPMLVEKEFFIRKALGWVLREAARQRPELTFAFLERHRDSVSGLTLREGAKHLEGPLRRRLGLKA